MMGTIGSLLTPGNYFSERQFLKTDPDTGVARTRSGTRIIALSRDFLIGVHFALVKECGAAAEQVLHSCGRRWGQSFAQRFEQELSDFYQESMQEFPMAMFEACLAEAFSHHGWGRLQLDFHHYDKGIFVAEMTGAIFADLVGSSERPVDSLLAGILAGIFTHFSGQELDCIQSACVACGAETSKFLISLHQRIEQIREAQKAGASHDELFRQLEETRV